MKTKKIFAVCDLDERYVIRLTDYLTQKHSVPFEVLAFSSLDSLTRFAEKHPIEILLISQDAMCGQVKSLNISRILILSEGEELELSDDEMTPSGGNPAIGVQTAAGDEYEPYPMIYKYQSTDSLAREVMNYYNGRISATSKSLQQLGTDVYAVYSPIARCGKTLFALTLAEVLGEKKKTLYLNLENFSGFESLFGQTYRSDLADLVYLSQKSQEGLPMKLDNVVRTMCNADYIPPAFFPSDLREISSDEWISFLANVAGLMDYQTIVMDIGSQPQNIPALLGTAGHIYMPLLPDPMSRAKVSQYEKDMEALSMRHILDRTVRLYLPEVGIKGSGLTFLDNLLSSPMGDYTRKLLDQEAAQNPDQDLM